MTNTRGPSPHRGYGEYLWNTMPIAADAAAPESPWGRRAWLTVGILGALIFGVGLGSPVSNEFPVRLSVLAAVVAAVGLLPQQRQRGWIVVACALTGFLDALAAWIQHDASRWASTVVLAVGALQALASIAALFAEIRWGSPTEVVAAQDYSAYAKFAQTYQAYAAQYQQSQAAAYENSMRAEQGGRAGAHVQSSGNTQQSAADMHARYAARGLVGPVSQPRVATGAAPSTPRSDPGVPAANTFAPQPSVRDHNPGHAYRPDAVPTDP